MKTLAFDTSTKYLSIALLDEGSVIAEYHEEAGIRHSEILIPTVKSLIEKAAWQIPDIELVCVGLGPGSFTGLRIGVAAVKGLAAVLGCKVIGVPTLDAIVLNYKGEELFVAPVLDAHKGKVYSSVYEHAGGQFNRSTEYLLVTVEELTEEIPDRTFFFGNAIDKYRDVLDRSDACVYSEEMDWYPRAADIGILGIEKFLKQGSDDPEQLDPLYLHSKECNINKG